MSFGFGTYRLNEKTYGSTLHAIRSGVNIIDTAPLYGNIEEVGRAVEQSLASKTAQES